MADYNLSLTGSQIESALSKVHNGALSTIPSPQTSDNGKFLKVDSSGAYVLGEGGGGSYVLPVATASALGGIKSGGDISIDASGIVSVNDNSHSHAISNISGLQSALNGKQATLIAGSGITISGNTISATGGGGGTTNYNDLSNKPSINNIALSGNKSFSDLGLNFVTASSLDIVTSIGTSSSDSKIPTESAVKTYVDSHSGGGSGYTVTRKTATSSGAQSIVNLASNDTAIITWNSSSTTALKLNLSDLPIEGEDYMCGAIFNFPSVAGLNFACSAPSLDYAIHWNSLPNWRHGVVYEVIFRCLWMTDSDGKIIISAKWSEI